jgi:hypothetical protein
MPRGELRPERSAERRLAMQTIVGIVAAGTGVALVSASLRNSHRKGESTGVLSTDLHDSVTQGENKSL